jgi:hypothetical protein
LKWEGGRRKSGRWVAEEGSETEDRRQRMGVRGELKKAEQDYEAGKSLGFGISVILICLLFVICFLEIVIC